MALRAGDWVEVRTRQEILRTLDRDGRLDGMPFMPQMLSYCGQIFRVLRSAHKTCDPVYTCTSRRLPSAVHLDLRCDGKAYGGCQAGCLLFWKEAWLKPVSDTRSSAHPPHLLRSQCLSKQRRRRAAPKKTSGVRPVLMMVRTSTTRDISAKPRNF